MEMLGFDSDFSLLDKDQWDGHHKPALNNLTAQGLPGSLVKPLKSLMFFNGASLSTGTPPQTHLWEMTGIKKPLLELQIMLYIEEGGKSPEALL